MHWQVMTAVHSCSWGEKQTWIQAVNVMWGKNGKVGRVSICRKNNPLYSVMVMNTCLPYSVIRHQYCNYYTSNSTCMMEINTWYNNTSVYKKSNAKHTMQVTLILSQCFTQSVMYRDVRTDLLTTDGINK